MRPRILDVPEATRFEKEPVEDVVGSQVEADDPSEIVDVLGNRPDGARHIDRLETAMAEQEPVKDVGAVDVAADHVAAVVDAEGDCPRLAGYVDQRDAPVPEEEPVDTVGVFADADDFAAVVDTPSPGGERVGTVDGRVGLREDRGRAEGQESQQEPDGSAAMRRPLSFGKLRRDSVHRNLLTVAFPYRPPILKKTNCFFVKDPSGIRKARRALWDWLELSVGEVRHDSEAGHTRFELPPRPRPLV